VPTAVRIVRDADDIGESVGGGDSFRRHQISCGPFFGKLESLSCPRTAIYSGSYNQTLRIQWNTPDDGCVFGLFRNMRGEGHLNGRPPTDDTIALWDLQAEVNGLLPPNMEWTGFKVPRSLLERVAEEQGLPLAHLLPKEGPMKAADPEKVRDLRQAVRAILDAGGVVNDSRSGSLTEDDEEDLIAAFVSCFKGSDDHPPLDRWRNRFRIARQTDDYFQAHLDRFVTVAELCRELRVSRRLLHYAMAEMYQCPPVSYHRRLRLQAVRSDLRDRSKRLSVSEAAARSGFHNLGDFSRYYSEMFSELPSVTAQSG
jgi:AraC family ethanolamine operon transcriptional activator